MRNRRGGRLKSAPSFVPRAKRIIAAQKLGRARYVNKRRTQKAVRKSFNKRTRNVVHNMKGLNHLNFMDLDRPGNDENAPNTITSDWFPDHLIVEDVLHGIKHEDQDTIIATVPDENQTNIENVVLERAQDKINEVHERSGQSIYLRGIRIVYRFEYKNNDFNDQFGTGCVFRLLLVNDRFENETNSKKDFFSHSKAYQTSENADGQDIDGAVEIVNGVAMYMSNKARNFDDNAAFFDKRSKIDTALNKTRYSVIKEWKFAFKRKFVGDEIIKRGKIYVPFKNKKITWTQQVKNANNANNTVVRPNKNYKLMGFWERNTGETANTVGKTQLGIKMHATVYWKDSAPFDG